MHAYKMTPKERNAVLSLSSIMSLRMFGLFMVLPVFSLYALHLEGATPTLIGLAMGIYGLTQAFFQIPFGALSDHFGRKKIIVIGLLLFALGSFIAATSTTIYSMLIGRALQGAGAVGSTLIAFIADLTREEHRSKAMAVVGISIGFSFSLAMMLGPVLNQWISVPGLFWLSAFFAFLGILLLLTVPHPPKPTFHPETEVEPHYFSTLLKHPGLLPLNAGIFILHAIFTASFVILPISLETLSGLHGTKQWMLYLPILLIAFSLSLPCIVIAERRKLLKSFFLGAILILGLSEFLFWIFTTNLLISAASLLLFFTAFSVLEAFLPSLVSRTAPPKRKGTALGLYSCSQFLGIFVGGSIGGWLYGHVGMTHVFLFCGVLTTIWILIALKMKNPQHQPF